jgi:hypothetical protein
LPVGRTGESREQCERDAAAESLQVRRPELKFALEGEPKELDQQIKAIRDAVAGTRR